jgi:hypothetical protein
MFLTGAYQDIMGDMHNLFGRVNEVHVYADDDDPEDFYLETVIPGDTVEKVLARVQYEPPDLVKRVKGALDQRVRDGSLKPKEGVGLSDFFEQVMKGYTYLRTPDSMSSIAYREQSGVRMIPGYANAVSIAVDSPVTPVENGAAAQSKLSTT